MVPVPKVIFSAPMANLFGLMPYSLFLILYFPYPYFQRVNFVSLLEEA